MKNILVTGGAGFIGSHTVVALHEAGYAPVIVDNFANSERSVIKALEKIIGQPVKTYEGEYQDIKLLEKIIKDEQIDGVIHFAAYKAVGESVEQPLKYYNNNVAGLVTLLEELERHGVPNVVFSSSCTVYGEPDHLPVSETAPMKPATSPYGSTKQMGEEVIRDASRASKTIKATALRYFNPIGAHESALIGELPIGIPSNLIPFLTQTVAGKYPELTVYGDDYDTTDGSCIRDYIHVADLAEAHVEALKHLEKQSSGYFDVFNLGTGQGSSVLEVIKSFEKATGKKVPYKIGSRRAGDVVATFASNQKAADVLGWKPKKTLEQALADAWKWQTKLT